jgi:hypothetical protein
VRRLLALFVATTCAVGLAGAATAASASAAVTATAPTARAASFASPVVTSSSSREILRKGPYAGSRSPSVVHPLDLGPPTAVINVTYTGFPTQARAAFQAAVDVWAHTVHSAVPIDVAADWSNLTEIFGVGVLGAANATNFVADFPNAPKQHVFYPVALANAISGSDQLKANLCTDGAISPTGAEIEATFNSAEPDWYYGTDGNVPQNENDLESVVLHELGHGLGFVGSYDGLNPQTGADQGNGYFGSNGSGTEPTVFDTFTTNSTGVALGAVPYTNGSSALGALLRGSNLGPFWNGAAGKAAFGGNRIPLYAPNPWEEGSSFSHLDEATFSPTGPHAADGLMSPILNQGEALHAPGAVMLGMFQDMGWPTSAVVPATSAGLYHAVTPVPISRLKSQTGIKAGGTVDVPVTGHFGVPAGVTAVVVNVEIKLPTSKGYWTVLPGCKGGSGLPAAGDFSAGLSRTGQATVPVSATGHIVVMSSSAASAINVDLVGWYSASGDYYHHLQSQLVAAVTNVNSAQQVDVLVAGKAGIPASGVDTVVLKTRVSVGTSAGYLAVGPGGQNSQIPTMSFGKGEMISNFLTVPLGTGSAAGKVHLRLTAGKAQVSLEAVGWYGPSSASGGEVFHPAGPARFGAALNGQDQIAPGLPGGSQVMLTVHLANPTGTGYLGSSPAGPGGLHGVQEYHAGQPVSGTIITTTNSLGEVRLRLSVGKSPMYVDWLGYFSAT